MLEATTMDESDTIVESEYLWEVSPPSTIGSTIVPNGSLALLYAGIIENSAQEVIETIQATDTLHNIVGLASVTIFSEIQNSLMVAVLPKSAEVPSGERLMLKATTMNGADTTVAGDYAWEISPPSTIGSMIEPQGSFALFSAGMLAQATQDAVETVVVTDVLHNVVGQTTITVLPQTEELAISGEIICPQYTSGLIFIQLRQGHDPFASSLVCETAINEPGRFMVPLQGIPENTPLWAYAFWDKDNSEGFPSHGDLFGSYANNPLVMQEGIDDIKITIEQEIALMIKGEVTSSEQSGGRILIRALDGPDALGANSLGGTIIDGY
jgi:hypothetical protein